MGEENEVKELSLERMSSLVRDAWYQQFNPGAMTGEVVAVEAWVCEVFSDHAIVRLKGEYFRAPYTMQAEEVIFSPLSEWAQVKEQREWVEVVKALEAKYGSRNNSSDRGRIRKVRGLLSEAIDVTRELEPKDTDDDPLEGMVMDLEKALVQFGEPVKAERKDDGLHVGGYLVRFTSAKDTDLEGEFFDAETDFDIEAFPAKTSVYFHHGLDAKVGKRKLGRADLTKDDVGLWAETILQERDEYEKFIAQLALTGKLGWSSGTAGHLSERVPAGKATRISRWPIVEASLTHTPAEPRNSVVPLKTLAITPETASQQDPQQAAGDAADGSAVERVPAIVKSTHRSTQGENAMADETNKTPELKAMEDRMTELSANLDRLTKLIEEAPAVRKSGYYSVDGGAADKKVKSFGDFLLAVKRGDIKRLAEVYQSIKDMDEDSGASGGYLVPPEYSTQLLQLAAQSSQIIGLCSRFPVTSNAGTWPALDQYTAVTAGSGNTSLAAGVVATKRAEGGTFTETDADLTVIKWRVNSIGGYTEVTNELIADNGAAIEALLMSLFSVACASKKEYGILRGNGVGEPLGILNAGAAVGIAPDTNNYFAWADALEMDSRLRVINPSRTRWALHRSLIPDIGTWELGTAGAGTKSIGDTGHGEPVYSEHLPQANNAGCALLADFSCYALFERGGLVVAFSEHAAFTSGKGTWRFDERYDGQPWMKSYVTLADPNGSFTVSPFIYLND